MTKQENTKNQNNQNKKNKNNSRSKKDDIYFFTQNKKDSKQKIPKNLKVKKIEINLNPRKWLNKSFVYIIIALLFLPVILSFLSLGSDQKISVSDLVTDIREEKVEKLRVKGSELIVEYYEGDHKYTRKEEGQEALQILEASGIDLSEVDLVIEDVTLGNMLWNLLLTLLPIGFTLILFLYFFKQTKGGGNGIFGIGKSKAKIYIKGKQSTKFEDVGGMQEAKKELEEVVDFLKHPKKYQKVGARTPKGVLLVGPSGTGKTLLARAVAGEANVQFLSIAGSEFIEMLVGVGASRVRDLFNTAKKIAPSIIFIDEIDAIGRKRGTGHAGSHDEREQTLNQILVEMDGFNKNDNVIVMAATNRSEMLDPALVRPGRFDRRVHVSLPDLKEREHIIKIHAKGKPFADDVDMHKVAKSTVGFSGADLENMLNEAAIAIAVNNRDKITMEDIEEASLKVKLGPSKKRLQDDYERKITAYHESGHAVLAHVLPNADRVHRISIVSRGQALGYTFTPPEKDRLQTTKSELLDDIVVMLGGRAAEQITFNEQTAGASNDIKKATRLARAMVMELGMSDLGPINFTPLYDKSNYNYYTQPSKISDEMQQKVDQYVNDIIHQAQKKATQLLNKHKKLLDKISQNLLEVETLDGDEFEKLMGIEKAKNPLRTANNTEKNKKKK